MEISESSEFAGAGSTVEVCFDYQGLACIEGNFKMSEFAGAGSTVEVGFDHRGLACINGDF